MCDRNPTRPRRVKGFFSSLLGLAALTAGLPAPALATAAPTPDAELVAACDRLLAVDAAIEALMSRRTTIEQERATNPDLDTLFAQRSAIEAEFDDMDQPTTPIGVAALARVGLAGWGYQCDGDRIAPDFEAWVHLSVLEFMAGEGGVANAAQLAGGQGAAE